jgi:hypothetical protein
LLITAIVLTGAACGDDTPTGPSAPEPVEVTELFPAEAPGTLARNGGDTHIFAVQQAGTITVSLTTLAPDSTALIGLALGSWNGFACSQTIVKDDATQGSSILGTATSTGNYCVRVYDATGALAQPVEYQVTVRHF